MAGVDALGWRTLLPEDGEATFCLQRLRYRCGVASDRTRCREGRGWRAWRGLPEERRGRPRSPGSNIGETLLEEVGERALELKEPSIHLLLRGRLKVASLSGI